MGLLERIQHRVETDVVPDELEALIAEAQDEIAATHGPVRSVTPITVDLRGGGTSLDITRPIDTAEDVEVIEYDSLEATADDTTLSATDFRIVNGGRTIERVNGGPNSGVLWAPRVTVAYIPVDDTAKRDEVTIKLVMLALDYNSGRRYDRIGDASAGYADYQTDRSRLIASLSHRPGLLMA